MTMEEAIAYALVDAENAKGETQAGEHSPGGTSMRHVAPACGVALVLATGSMVAQEDPAARRRPNVMVPFYYQLRAEARVRLMCECPRT